MAKSRITPEQKARRAQLGPLMEGAGIKSMEDIQELFKDMIATFVNQGLEANWMKSLVTASMIFATRTPTTAGTAIAKRR